MNSSDRPEEHSTIAERLRVERPELHPRERERLRRWLDFRERFLLPPQTQRQLALGCGVAGVILGLLSLLGLAGTGPLG